MLSPEHISDKRVVTTSLVASFIDILLNLMAAWITGSTVMLSQSLQGIFDFTANSLLFVGVHRSSRKADEKHRLGFGREIFFWVLFCSLLMFAGTGGLSFYFGYQQYIKPDKLNYIPVAFAILSFGLIMSLYSLSLSIRRIRGLEPGKKWLEQLFDSSFIETKTTLLIDMMGSIAAILGLVALLAYIISGDSRFDGLGSMLIGLSMMIGVGFLIRDVGDLIVGRSANSEISMQIRKVAESVDGIVSILDILTLYIGSARLLVILEVHIKDGLETDEIEQIVDNVKNAVTTNVPLVHHIQVEIETPDDPKPITLTSIASAPTPVKTPHFHRR